MWGGAIANSGTLNITDSIISNNVVSSYGGGIYNGGALSATNNTLSGNFTGWDGGGIYNDGELWLSNTTLISNTAGVTGGGVFIFNGAALTMTNSIIAGSASEDCFGAISSLGYNIAGDNSCNLNGPGDMNDTDPLVGPLQDNGGPTWTHALLEGSPAIDAGDNAQCPPTDQRGIPRPLDGNGDGEAICDIGSYEYSQNHLIVTTLDDELNRDGDCSLREAITAANENMATDACPAGDAVITDTITFDVAGTITLTEQLTVTVGGPLTIDGGEAITVSGNHSVRVLSILTGAFLKMIRMDLADGSTPHLWYGSNINNAGTLEVHESTISGANLSGIYNIGRLVLT